MRRFLKKGSVLKTLASIEIGVVIIIAIGALTAWGTLVEAHYNDAAAAQKLVYHSYWMYGVMIALATCLIAVMIDRWPWQQKHTGFVLAHIGILIIMIGSLVTRYFGIDGSMQLEPGGSSRVVLLTDPVLTVSASMGDMSFRRVFEKSVDFFVQRPTPAKPYEIPLPGGNVKILEYLPYAFLDEKVVASEREFTGGAIRFQLQNPKVSLTEWLVQPAPGRVAIKNLGPAQVILAHEPQMSAVGRNCIVLVPIKDSDELDYEIHTARDPKAVKRGRVRPGDTLETGWMGLVFRMLKYLPHAEEQISFKPTHQMTPMTTSALRLSYGGQEHWLGFGSRLRLFSDQAVYVIQYRNTHIELDFDIHLKEFKVGRYPGTIRAASYESLVAVPGPGDVTISMNEPLKTRGYTFYQASFQEDEQRRPIASILSVNWDPGRWIKYLGSLLIVFGTIHLFYFKRRVAKGK